MSDDAPQISLNLMKKRRRRAQYRLRRRRFLGIEALPGEAPAEGEVPPSPAPPRTEPGRKVSDDLAAMERECHRLRVALDESRGMLAGHEREVSSLRAQLEESGERYESAKKVVEEARGQVQRARAEMDANRRRLQKEKDEMKEHAAEDLLRRLLPILDNFSLALKNSEPLSDPASILKGVTMIEREFSATLERAGLRPIPTEGHPFDPQVHDAISTAEEPEKPDGEVLSELRPGYLYHQKVLRPAMVSVNKLTETPPPGSDQGARSAPSPAADQSPPVGHKPATPLNLRPTAPPPRRPEEAPPPPRPSTGDSTPLDDAKRYLDTNY